MWTAFLVPECTAPLGGVCFESTVNWRLSKVCIDRGGFSKGKSLFRPVTKHHELSPLRLARRRGWGALRSWLRGQGRGSGDGQT